MINEAERELMKRLKLIWNDKDFVCGVMSGLRQANKVDKLLEFLIMAERRGEKYTSDQITALTITLRKQRNQ